MNWEVLPWITCRNSLLQQYNMDEMELGPSTSCTYSQCFFMVQKDRRVSQDSETDDYCSDEGMTFSALPVPANDLSKELIENRYLSVDIFSRTACQRGLRNQGFIQEKKEKHNLLSVPVEILETIFSFLSFETVGKIRLVCQQFNSICSNILNKQFRQLQNLMQQRFQKIKTQMPRRESARRKHPLARESDIIETLHMRLSLLQMTFGKHIERKHCCFFPGEILDEVFHILRYLKTTLNISRAYKVTDELFDLSTMAMEYFKEKIEPTLPEITCFATDFLDYMPSFSSSPKTQLSLMEEPPSSKTCTSAKNSSLAVECVPPPRDLHPSFKKRLRKLRENMKKNNGQVLTLKRDLKQTRQNVSKQQKQLQEFKAQLDDYNHKFHTTSRKLNAVLQELNRCKTELQYWRSKSPAAQCSCGKITPISELKDQENGFSREDIQFQDSLPLDFKEFTPIVMQQTDVVSFRDESCPLVIPACHTTPIENTSSLTPYSPTKSFPQKKDYSKGFSPLNEDYIQPIFFRACRRKLDLEDTVNIVCKAAKHSINGSDTQVDFDVSEFIGSEDR
ncbi:F-box protein dampened isoform X2 [Tachypleus tridentatus]|uniref:F-box protein dampened isoform X2 n=1 Tax=Tachypleus tridentatus TaxID=6853 RepID=UPI003FD0316D